jgi:hypothetical protein
MSGVHQMEGLVDASSGDLVGDHRVDLDRPSMYQSTIFGVSVRSRAPPTPPFQVRPVTS